MHRTNQHPGARALGDAHTHTHAQFDAEQSRAEDAEHGQIVSSDASSMTFVSPNVLGAYRVFAFVQNSHHQVSVANVPFLVE